MIVATRGSGCKADDKYVLMFEISEPVEQVIACQGCGVVPPNHLSPGGYYSQGVLYIVTMLQAFSLSSRAVN